ncbi:MAG: GNAT family N-acetyltransferase [Acidimicrobiia bacterium]
MDCTVRPARPEDSEALGRVHIAAWQAAYRGLMPGAFLDALDPAARAKRWRAALLEGPGDGRYRAEGFEALTLVIEGDDGQVAGIGVVGPPRRTEPSGVGELWMINLEPAVWGSGLGTQLLAVATDELRRAGYVEAVLWVLAANHRARRFYEREGWKPDGTEITDGARGFPVTELRYRRSL